MDVIYKILRTDYYTRVLFDLIASYGLSYIRHHCFAGKLLKPIQYGKIQLSTPLLSALWPPLNKTY
jgi:hypothetical protein